MFSSNSSQVSQDAVFVEDIFSTYLYTGNGSTQTITNGIDLAGKGGLVWTKRRNLTSDNVIHDTARGVRRYIITNGTDSQVLSSVGTDLTAFNSNGYTLGTNYNPMNGSGDQHVSWTFREQPKFFDIVTYTGNGANRTIAHNLGSVPGCIIVKRTDTAADWQVYHRSLANTEYMVLNTTAAKATGATRWNSTTPTSTVFSLGTDATVNANGGTYVAYLFAHDAGGFGTAGTDNVISCGSYTGNGSTGQTIELGYEPQWLMSKKTSGTSNWVMLDTMRGYNVGNGDVWLEANSSGSENGSSSFDRGSPTSTGFAVTDGLHNDSGATYIYIAIRRGPMKTPTSGTSVYNAIARNGNSSAGSRSGVGFAPDLWIAGARATSGASDHLFADRLRGPLKSLGSTSTAAEGSSQPTSFDQDGVTYTGSSLANSPGVGYIDYFFRRAPGFFDEVCYTGTGVNRTVSHNLGVVPELIIEKRRDFTGNWNVYTATTGAGNALQMNVTNASAATSLWNSTAPTSSVFSVGTNDQVNGSGLTYVAYLFASCPGVSKVGTYTGTGTTLQINCGFTGGARFVLIKRTDSTGDWYVWDTARGIVSGNDPYLLLNSTAAETTSTDYIDAYSAGFEISSTAPAAINASGGTFIYMAIS